jgi:chorismate mutase
MTASRSEVELLHRSRQEIESIDRSIVWLLAARLDAARRALHIRTERGTPLTDRDQEHRVLGRSREWAEEVGVPAEMVDRLFRSLIEEGKARFRRAERAPGAPVVTVLLAGPDEPPGDLRGRPDAELVAVPASR